MTKDRHAERLVQNFGRRLRAVRIASGFDAAEDFASNLGIEAARYRKYERGESMPPIDILELISKTTNRDLDWLLLGRALRREAE